MSKEYFVLMNKDGDFRAIDYWTDDKTEALRFDTWELANEHRNSMHLDFYARNMEVVSSVCI